MKLADLNTVKGKINSVKFNLKKKELSNQETELQKRIDRRDRQRETTGQARRRACMQAGW